MEISGPLRVQTCSRTECLPSADEAVRLQGPGLRRALSLVTVAWVFGSVWSTAIAGTPITNYAKALNASEFQFGLLAALPYLASLLSLPASILIEATGLRKRIFLWGQYPNRLLWFPIVLVPLWLVWRYGTPANGPAMSAFLWLLFVMYAGQAVGGPAWNSWMADIVPERARGKYFARRRQWGFVSGIGAACIVGVVLDWYARRFDPARGVYVDDPFAMLFWCAIIFMVAAVFGMVDIHLFQYVPDIPRKPNTGLQLLKAMKEPLKNRQFLWIGGFVGTMWFAVSFMGQFVTKFVMEQMGGGGGGTHYVNWVTQMMLIVAPNLGAILVLGAWGRAADRMGKKPLLVAAALGLAPVALGWCLVGPRTVWLGYVLSMVGAVAWQGVDIANWNLVMEVSGSGDENGGCGGSAYAAVNSVISNVAGCMGGLAAGAIAQWLADWQWVTSFKVFTYYDVLFILSFVMRGLSVVVFLPHIREENARPTQEAIRFMTGNIYNNLFNAVQQPLKFIRGRRRRVGRLVAVSGE